MQMAHPHFDRGCFVAFLALVSQPIVFADDVMKVSAPASDPLNERSGIPPVYGAEIGGWGTPHQVYTAHLAIKDGELWVSILDAQEHAFYHVDSDSGMVLGTFPFSRSIGCDGFAWDGTRWRVLDGFRRRVHRLTESGESVDWMPAPGARPLGLAFDGQEFWCHDFDNGLVLRFDANTGQVLQSFVQLDGRPFGLSYADGLLFSTGRNTESLYAFDAATGALVAQSPSPTPFPGQGDGLSGIAATRTRVWVVDTVGSWTYAFVRYRSGDLDDDGDVDFSDFGLFAICFQGNGNPPAPVCEQLNIDADLDDDGDVDLGDFAIFAEGFTGTLSP